MNTFLELKMNTEGAGRRATWLELFYDLIYVAVIAKLAVLFHSDFTFTGFCKFVFLFLPIWWAWVGHTMYANRFDSQDNYHRYLTFVQMAAALLLALFIEKALNETANYFAMTYIFIRLTYVISYIRVFVNLEETRPLLKTIIIGFSIGIILWLISIWFEPPIKYYLWGAGMLIDLITPRYAAKSMKKISVHSQHLPERLGLFVIIVLGESIVAVLQGVGEVNWEVQEIGIALLGFIAVISIWCLYFECLEKFIVGKVFGSGHPYLYGHLPVYIGLITLAVGIENNLINDSHVSTSAVCFTMCAGLTLFLCPIIYFQKINVNKEVGKNIVVPDLIFLLVLALLAYNISFLNKSIFSILFTVLFLCFVIFKFQMWRNINPEKIS